MGFIVGDPLLSDLFLRDLKLDAPFIGPVPFRLFLSTSAPDRDQITYFIDV